MLKLLPHGSSGSVLGVWTSLLSGCGFFLLGCGLAVGGSAASPAISVPEIAPVNLAGTVWQVIELRGRWVFSPQALTLKFEEQDRLSGYSGCNAYAATYRQQELQLQVTDLRQTLQACLTPQSAQNEQELLQILQGAREVRRDPQDRLVIFSLYGTLMAQPLDVGS